MAGKAEDERPIADSRPQSIPIDLLSVGLAVYDLSFAVERPPDPDEKVKADCFTSGVGGPAAVAALTAARLGINTALAAKVGRDLYGDLILQELANTGVDGRALTRSDAATAVSAVVVKRSGSRSIVTYRDPRSFDEELTGIEAFCPQIILTDGHEPAAIPQLTKLAKKAGAPLILDAGSVNSGTIAALKECDYLVASEIFALKYTGKDLAIDALRELAEFAPVVIITLGHRGLVWQRNDQSGRLPAFEVPTMDSTGAGDVFHGALAAGLIQQLPWEDLLVYAAAAAALACTRLGGQASIPTSQELQTFLTAKTTT